MPVFLFCVRFAIIVLMDGIGYEDWCAKWLKKNGFHKITKTKASNDQGIDLIAERGGLSWGFQCKYYSSHVGNEAVQQAYAGMTYYGLDKAAVLCNTAFTKSAEKLAEQTGVILVSELQPEGAKSSTLLLKIIGLAGGGLCAWQYYELIRSASELPQRQLSILAFAFLSSLCALFTGSRIITYVLCALCAAVYVSAALAAGAFTDALAVLMAVILLLALIRMVILMRDRNEKEAALQKAQLDEMIAKGQKELGENIAGLLASELRTSVKAQRTRRRSDGSAEIHCRSAADISDDLAVAVYSLNMQADAERENIRFEYEIQDDTHFVIRIRDKERGNTDEMV